MNVILEKIKDFYRQSNPDTGRIFHGRGRMYPGFEGILIDAYPPVVLITLFEELKDSELEKLVAAVKRQEAVTCLVLQRRYLPQAPGEIVFGTLPEDHVVTENGCKFSINLNRAQNSGLFLDMANGRQWLLKNSQDKRVLNLFSYTCSLSVTALLGGAAHVVNFDLSKPALNSGRQNHRINDVEMKKVEFLPMISSSPGAASKRKVLMI